MLANDIFFDIQAVRSIGAGRGKRDARPSARPIFNRAESRSRRGVNSEPTRSQFAMAYFSQAQMAESLRSQFEHLFDKFRRLWARPIFYRAESRSQFGVSAESIRHGPFIIGPSGGVTDAPARKEVKAARAILGSSHSSRCIMLGSDSAARPIGWEASWEGFAIWRRVGRLFLDGRNFSSRPVHFRPGRKVSNHPHHVVILSSAPIMCASRDGRNADNHNMVRMAENFSSRPEMDRPGRKVSAIRESFPSSLGDRALQKSPSRSAKQPTR